MLKLNVELFVARRLGSGALRGVGGARGSETHGRGVMVRIAVTTVAVAVAVMILAVAVISGFRAEISGKITAFTGHVKVQAADYGLTGGSEPITLSEELRERIATVPGVLTVSPYALKTGVIKTADATHGVMLKGVDASYDLALFAESLVEGTLPRLSDSVRHKDILISVGVARMMRLGVDSRLEMIFVDGGRPRRDRFRVCGLYSTGFGEMDNRFAVTDINDVRRLEGWTADEASGYEIRLAGMDGIAEATQSIGAIVAEYGVGLGSLAVLSVVDEFPQHFDWLATHDVNAAVIIVIMVVVALISMLSALLVIVFERIRMIGILKTLGMTNRALRRVFVARAAQVVLWGLIIGNVLGIGMAMLQRATGVMRLDEQGYFISRVPIELSAWWIAALDVGTFVVIVGLMVLPTAIVSRITPEKTVRYQ